MSVSTPAPSTGTGPAPRISNPARWSLLMLPVFVVVYFVTAFVGEYVVLDLLDLPEGSLFLMAGGFAGWAVEILFALVLVSAPLAGTWLAVRAVRSGAGTKAWTGLVLNGLLVLLVLYMFIDAVRMSYFAPLD